MRPRRSSSLDDLLSFGGRVPPVVGGLIAALVLLSIFGRLGGFAAAGVFVPAYVLGGQAWRLVTWPFFEGDPLSLLFGGLMLYWFGRDLCWAWGPRRFLATFFGIAIFAATVTTLLSLSVYSIRGQPYAGAWAVLGALTVAWASIFPERQILLMFAIPIAGRTLLWITVGGTLLYALFYGFQGFVPHLVAQGGMALYLRGVSPKGMLQSLKIRSLERKARRRASHLKVVDKDGANGRGPWMN
jgi:membrane associated rhomboid family serine protease